MLSMQILVARMRRRLPKPVFNAVDLDFFMDILFGETLAAMSAYYPRVVKGIRVTSNMALPVTDSDNLLNLSSKYIIPMVDDLYPYTAISEFLYPRNFLGGGTFSNPGVIDAVISTVTSSMNRAEVRFTGNFEGPNIIEVVPAPRVHQDFNVSLYRVPRLSEIRTGYHENFIKLFEADCKIALYYKFYQLEGGGTFGGIELKDFVSDFKDYESKRDDLLEMFEKDYFKDPDRYEEIWNYSNLKA